MIVDGRSWPMSPLSRRIGQALSSALALGVLDVLVNAAGMGKRTASSGAWERVRLALLTGLWPRVLQVAGEPAADATFQHVRQQSVLVVQMTQL
jgi:hypothetical protein